MKVLESTFKPSFDRGFYEQLLSKLKVKNFSVSEEYVLPISNELAEGHIKVIPSGKYKWYTEINLECFSNVKLPFLTNETDLIHFIYCCKGQGIHQMNGEETVIDEFQTAIIIDKESADLILKKGETVKIAIISVEKPKEMITSVVSEIFRIFEEKLENKKFAYYGSSNLKISDQIGKISSTEKNGVVKKLFVEGVIQLILAMEIQHHHKDISSISDVNGLLTLKEQKIIKDIAEEIQNNCDYPFSIKYLIQQTGLPAAKLQEGFKLLYNRTVTDYIKNIRIEKAENLLKTTDLNISEVVYTIGFTSRSYFSKIFKEKYNCSPRYYQEKSRVYSLATSA